MNFIGDWINNLLEAILKYYSGKYEIDIYDPRRGENWEYKLFDNSLFSSLENDLLVIEIMQSGIDYTASNVKIMIDRGHPDVPYGDIFTKNVLRKLGGKGFACLSSIPRAVSRSNHVDLNDVDLMSGSMVGYFELNSNTIQYQIDCRRKFASIEEWGIGCCRSKFESKDKTLREHKVSWNLDYILSQPNNINCISYFIGEWDWTIIITEIFDGIDELLKVSKMIE